MSIVQSVPQWDVVPRQARCNLLGPATGANTTSLPLHYSLAPGGSNGAVVYLEAAHVRPSGNVAANADSTTFRIRRRSDNAIAASITNVAQITAAAGAALTLGTLANRTLAPGDEWIAEAVNVVSGEALQAVTLSFTAAYQGKLG
jgi:hypothetical protein